MEGLIIMIVIAILSRLFAGKGDDKKKKPSSSMPPFSNDKPLSKPVQSERPVEQKKASVEVKSLEDFANEVFGQLQQKTQQAPAEPQKAETIVVEEKIQRPALTERAVVQVRAESTRPSIQERKEQLGAERPILQRNKDQNRIAIPKTRQDLVQSIVMADILAKPKSQRTTRL